MGIKRKIDKLNRISIPKEYLNENNIKPNDELDISNEDGVIGIIKPNGIKTATQIQERIDKLKRLQEDGFDDDAITGNVQALEWVLNGQEDSNDYLNDY